MQIIEALVNEARPVLENIDKLLHTSGDSGCKFLLWSIYLCLNIYVEQTNNNVESFHNTLLNKIGVINPNIWDFTGKSSKYITLKIE